LQLDSSQTRAVGATGLCLAFTNKIVELMNGMLGVESAVGKGSIFVVVVPRRRAESTTSVVAHAGEPRVHAVSSSSTP
jgi:two-component system sensor histidine kinase/response regulator